MEVFNVTSPHKHIVYSEDSEDEEENALGKICDTYFAPEEFFSPQALLPLSPDK
jgi:hypothetical protein